MDRRVEKLLASNELRRPTLCQKCEGVLVYRGIGEYICEECGAVEYDDYGKVRNYLERHRGANVAEISDMTGVSHKAIRDMIKEKRFEIIDNKGGYLRWKISWPSTRRWLDRSKPRDAGECHACQITNFL